MSDPRYPTNFTEANALLAVVRGEIDIARQIIDEMLPGEGRALAEQAHELADILGERGRFGEAATRACRFGDCSHGASGYFMLRGRPRGICQHHRERAAELGYVVHEAPVEVKL